MIRTVLSTGNYGLRTTPCSSLSKRRRFENRDGLMFVLDEVINRETSISSRLAYISVIVSQGLFDSDGYKS